MVRVQTPGIWQNATASASFRGMQRMLNLAQRGGVQMMHTARPFEVYRKVFYDGQASAVVLRQLRGRTVVDVGCGFTPFARDSMFRACHDAGIEFFAVDPLLRDRVRFGPREWALARATGGSGSFNRRAPGLSRALAATAQAMPFADEMVDEILCSFLLFVWIEDESTLADIFSEFRRVLRPGGRLKLYPMYPWAQFRPQQRELRRVLGQFDVQQRYVSRGFDRRVMPSLLTLMTRR